MIVKVVSIGIALDSMTDPAIVLCVCTVNTCLFESIASVASASEI